MYFWSSTSRKHQDEPLCSLDPLTLNNHVRRAWYFTSTFCSYLASICLQTVIIYHCLQKHILNKPPQKNHFRKLKFQEPQAGCTWLCENHTAWQSHSIEPVTGCRLYMYTVYTVSMYHNITMTNISRLHLHYKLHDESFTNYGKLGMHLIKIKPIYHKCISFIHVFSLYLNTKEVADWLNKSL